jgi:hypothetical protein
MIGFYHRTFLLSEQFIHIHKRITIFMSPDYLSRGSLHLHPVSYVFVYVSGSSPSYYMLAFYIQYLRFSFNVNV